MPRLSARNLPREHACLFRRHVQRVKWLARDVADDGRATRKQLLAPLVWEATKLRRGVGTHESRTGVRIARVGANCPGLCSRRVIGLPLLAVDGGNQPRTLLQVERSTRLPILQSGLMLLGSLSSGCPQLPLQPGAAAGVRPLSGSSSSSNHPVQPLVLRCSCVAGLSIDLLEKLRVVELRLPGSCRFRLPCLAAGRVIKNA